MSTDSQEASTSKSKPKEAADAPSERVGGDSAPVTTTAKSKSFKQMTASALISHFEEAQLKKKVPSIYVGDTVRVGLFSF